MNTSVLSLDGNEKAFALAVAVIEDRVRQLPKEDRDDLFELMPAIFGEDEEEKQAAIRAAQEILQQSTGKVQRVECRQQSIEKWLAFISARIRQAREGAGLTQTQLAEKSGLQQSHISRLEKGEHSPTQKTLEKIAIAVGTDIDYFSPSSD